MAVCERTTFCSLVFVITVVTTSIVPMSKVAADRACAATDDCALFKATQTETFNSGRPTFIDIGKVDVTESFSVSMEVLAHPFSHDGVLFSISWTPNFSLTAPNGEYLILEFIHSSLTLTIKTTSLQHPKMIELSRTLASPEPYDVADLHWHSVKASRRDGRWTVKFDDSSKSEPVNQQTDVKFTNKEAFVGGRPGYFQYQYGGIIRNVRVNNHLVELRDLPTQGDVEVVSCSRSCSTGEVEYFIAGMQGLQDEYYDSYGPIA